MMLPQDLLFQEVSVHYEERSGWVRIFTDPDFHTHPQLPIYLAGTLNHWFRERPQLRLRCIVPISAGGATVELQAWFDLHVFPVPANGQAQTPARD